MESLWPAYINKCANSLGRDFIVDDLHGCLDLLDIELDRVGFDPAVDRLFSVGDLIDRGPDSMGCLRLLNKPWFFAVRGNQARQYYKGRPCKMDRIIRFTSEILRSAIRSIGRTL